MFFSRIGDKLVRNVGAVKCVSYFRKSGRSYKILIDDIAFAYFSKLKDEEDQEKLKKEAPEVRRERTKRSLLMLEKFLCSSLYLTFCSVTMINKQRI